MSARHTYADDMTAVDLIHPAYRDSPDGDAGRKQIHPLATAIQDYRSVAKQSKPCARSRRSDLRFHPEIGRALNQIDHLSCCTDCQRVSSESRSGRDVGSHFSHKFYLLLRRSREQGSDQAFQRDHANVQLQELHVRQRRSVGKVTFRRGAFSLLARNRSAFIFPPRKGSLAKLRWGQGIQVFIRHKNIRNKKTLRLDSRLANCKDQKSI